MKKKALYLCMILAMVLVFTCSNIVFAIPPRYSIAGPSSGTVEVGGTITYPVSTYYGATVFDPSYVVLIGFSANVNIANYGDSLGIILSNIQGSVGSECTIYIAAGANPDSRQTGTATSFTIVATYNPTPAPQPSNPDNGNNQLPPSTDNGNNSNNNNQNPEQKPEEKDEVAPVMEIAEFSKSSCELGETITFDIIYKDNKEVTSITLEPKDITIHGFKADVKITGEGNSKRTVTLSNISGNLGGLKYVTIAAGTAADKAGNKVKEGGKTAMFKVVNSDTKNRPDDWIENPNTGKIR